MPHLCRFPPLLGDVMLNALRKSIGQASSSNGIAVRTLGGVALTEAAQAGDVPALHQPAASVGNFDVSSIQQIARFRSIVHLVNENVTETHRRECIVLDMGYSTVHIVCMPEFLARSAYDTFREAARRESLSIEKTITAPGSVIAELYAMADAQQRPGLAMVESTRHTQLYDDLARGAFELGASDIHITLGNATTKSKVRVRRHGRMRDWKQFDTPVLLAALSAGFQSKTRTGTNSGGSFNVERAMSTMTNHLIGDTHVNCRLSSYPLINNGCAIVLRLLQSGAKREAFPTLKKLGYSPQQIEQIMRALATTKGLILLNGPTGSGKSTSLRSFIYAIPRWQELCIRAVEEPVEYELPGVDQMSVQTSVDDEPEEVQKRFNAALKQMVRMDPDVGMMGEIRDALSAHMALQLVQTGHKGLATLHGDSAEDALFRLIGKQFEVDPNVLASSVTASGYQKLLPVLCDKCKISAGKILPATTQKALTEKFGLNLSSIYCANEEGCEKCWNEELNYGGTLDQTLVAEFLTPTTPVMRQFIREGDFEGLRLYRRQLRTAKFHEADTMGKTALEHALYKVSEGDVDPRDIEADFEPLDGYEVVEPKAC